MPIIPFTVSSKPTSLADKNALSNQARGLIGYWPILPGEKGKFRDLSGNNFTLTSTSTPDICQLSNGPGVRLNGTTQRLYWASSSSATLATWKITVSARVKFNSVSGSLIQVMAIGQDASVMVQLVLVNQKCWFSIINQSPAQINCVSTTTFVANKEYHIVGVHDGVKSWIYINGVLETTISAPSTSLRTSTANQIFIGSNSTPSRWVNGVISDVRVYNRALSIDEAIDLYRNKLSLVNKRYHYLEDNVSVFQNKFLTGSALSSSSSLSYSFLVKQILCATTSFGSSMPGVSKAISSVKSLVSSSQSGVSKAISSVKSLVSSSQSGVSKAISYSLSNIVLSFGNSSKSALLNRSILVNTLPITKKLVGLINLTLTSSVISLFKLCTFTKSYLATSQALFDLIQLVAVKYIDGIAGATVLATNIIRVNISKLVVIQPYSFIQKTILSIKAQQTAAFATGKKLVSSTTQTVTNSISFKLSTISLSRLWNSTSSAWFNSKGRLVLVAVSTSTVSVIKNINISLQSALVSAQSILSKLIGRISRTQIIGSGVIIKSVALDRVGAAYSIIFGGKSIYLIKEYIGHGTGFLKKYFNIFRRYSTSSVSSIRSNLLIFGAPISTLPSFFVTIFGTTTHNQEVIVVPDTVDIPHEYDALVLLEVE